MTMQIDCEDRDEMRILTVVADRIDAAIAIQFKDAVRAATQDAPPRVILNLHQVSFIDSSGLGAIVAGMKLLPKGTQMELASLNEAVDKVFRMTRMDSVFKIHADAAAL